METPPRGSDEPSEHLVTALVQGLDRLRDLVRGIETGAADLGVDRSTWASALAGLEWSMAELRTNEHVVSGCRLTEEDVARVRLLGDHLRRALDGSGSSSELHGLAVRTLETMCGANWRSAAPRRGQGLFE